MQLSDVFLQASEAVSYLATLGFYRTCFEPSAVQDQHRTLRLELASCFYYVSNIFGQPVPVAAPSKAWVCGYSLDEIAGSNPAGGMDVVPLVSVVYCRVEVSATSCSLVQMSPTYRGVS
jgi:hypothetical protein